MYNTSEEPTQRNTAVLRHQCNIIAVLSPLQDRCNAKVAWGGGLARVAPKATNSRFPNQTDRGVNPCSWRAWGSSGLFGHSLEHGRPRPTPLRSGISSRGFRRKLVLPECRAETDIAMALPGLLGLGNSMLLHAGCKFPQIRNSKNVENWQNRSNYFFLALQDPE